MKIIALVILILSVSAHAYVEEEIRFPVGNGIALTGYVARPNAIGKYPILVLQMGHGHGTTDSKTRNYNPFAELSRSLADKGFLVLRFDKRGTGYNETNGSFADGTFSDYANDLKDAIRYVQNRSDVSASEVYLFGHSLGGPVISIAALDLPEVRGIILSASPGRHFSDFNLEQMRYLLEMGQGLNGEALESELAKVERSNKLISKPVEFCQEFPSDCSIKDGKAYMWGQSADFWKEIAALDPLQPLRALKCKIFAIHGSSDWVVSSDNDGGAIRDLLSTNPNFSSKILTDLDHFLLRTNSKKASVDLFLGGLKDINLKIHPEFISEISSTLTSWHSQ